MNEYYYDEVDGVIDLSNNNTFSCSKKHKKSRTMSMNIQLKKMHSTLH